MAKIAIVGSSTLSFSQFRMASMLVDMICSWYTNAEHPDAWGQLTLVSGGATGIDSLAEDVACNKYGWKGEIYLPTNPWWEPAGYKERNLKIAEECEALFCIRSRNAKTYGSGWTADRAEELGKEVWRHYV